MTTSIRFRQQSTVLVKVLVILLSARQAAYSRDLDKLIPGLYGGQGITLATQGPPQIVGHRAHFTTEANNALTRLNSQLAQSFAAFPFNSSAGSFAFNFDRDLGTLVNTTETLGPIFSERAATIGRGKWALSFYGTFFDYDTFNGQSMHDLHAPALHIADLPPQFDPSPPGSPPGTRTSFERDILDIAVDVDASVKIFSPTVTYGVTDKLDITALLPIVSVDMDVRSRYTLVVDPENTNPTVHNPDPALGATPQTDRKKGDKTGVGDLVLAAKYRMYENGPVDLAGAMLGQFATGDEDNFLGTGDTMLRPFLVASRTFRQIAGSPLNLTPHLNLGYRFNLNHFDRSAFEYAAGFDFGIRRISLAWDLIGSHYNEGWNRLDTAIGARWNFWRTLVLTGNLMFPLNDDGVRSDIITTLGIGATF